MFFFAASLQAFAQTSLTSHFVKKDVLEQIVTDFDLATIRSSLGPRRDQSHRTLHSFGFTKSTPTPNTLVLEDEGFIYQIQLLHRGDLNQDGVEDLALCLTEKAKQGTYHAQKPLLVSKYTATGMAVALQFEIDGCERFAR
ncbi:hypothetical protein [Undibacterium fentianense]|uniref:Uncharacterized protein n=1 Tax=Undibacterium fentianense TaxID=2828728 RepID=A0A941E3P1_9BURK|nr:hypothetical protein [Undibacterium fentianense]MBR7800517.1 hypothetical protein [Undibacterium fentianense]